MENLKQLISQSPRSPEDKAHWDSILPKLSEEQQKQLHHILSTKIEVARAIDLIQKSLDIIADAKANIAYFLPDQ